MGGEGANHFSTMLSLSPEDTPMAKISTFILFISFLTVPVIGQVLPVPTHPPDGATDQATTVTLRWVPVLLADSYDVQVSTSSDFRTTVKNLSGIGSTATELSGLSEGTTYYWRVRAVIILVPGLWSSASRFTTSRPEPQAPDTPVLSSPPNGSTNQSKTLLLDWNSAANADSYSLQVSTNSSFSSLIVDQSGISGTSREVSGLTAGTTYYWRVSAQNSDGTSGWSNAWSFSTLVNPPSVPTLVSPANGATNQPATLTLDWNSAANAATYQLQVSTNPGFASPVVDESGLTETSRQIAGLSPGTTYSWRVRAANAGGAGGWTEPWNFTTSPAEPGIPTLVSPANGTTDLQMPVTLVWDHVSGSDSYRLQVSTDPMFGTNAVDASGITEGSREVSGLSPGTTYYWRVNARNSGGTSAWSDSWSFTTQVNPPSPPSLVSPASGSTNQPTTLTLDWSGVTGANTYQVQVSTNSDLSSPFIDLSGIRETSRGIDGLSNATAYHWRVRAANEGGDGGWSEVWSFSTDPAEPGIPTLVSPANGATDLQTPVTLAWSEVPGSDYYHLQVATNSTFSTTLLDESSLKEVSYEENGLSSGTTYYWRVQAANAAGSGGWSEVWNFTIDSSGLASTYSLSTTIDFPRHENLSDYSTADYKIIGLPGASNAPLADFLPGNAGRDWQAYWDNGRESDYWVAYDGGPTFVFSVGRAFWILNRGPWTINSVVPIPETNANGQVEIPLHEGWNLITCPFLSSVLWPEVQQLNSTNEPLYRYIDGGYANSGYLEPYTGYYWFNDNSASVLLVPSEDSPGPPGRGKTNASTAQGRGWRINITATNGIAMDDLLWIGSERHAESGKDATDVHKPRPMSGFGTYFNRPEWDRTYSSFASDVRPPVETSERWTFSIQSAKRDGIQLSFLGLEEVPDNLGAILVDEQSGEVIDLRMTNVYVFNGHEGVSTFSILVGEEHSIATGLRSIGIPGEFALGSNYPNPFNPSTTIPYELPRESEVKLIIHDLLGRRIKTLMSGTIQQGRHRVTWDGRNDAGAVVPSGVYFSRLEITGGTVLSRPMILTK